MVESIYRFRDITADNALDVLSLEEKVYGKISVDDQAFFLEVVGELSKEATDVEGSQNGFVVYDSEIPVAYLGISSSIPETPLGEVVHQHLEGFVTDPEYRSMALLNTVFDQVLSTQNPNFIYCYTADAALDTTYHGLSKPDVQRWLKRKGYSFEVLDTEPNQDGDSYNVEGTKPILLYPARWNRLNSDTIAK